jgi:hypothetical protein
MEAAALGIDYRDIEPQCVAALMTAAKSGSWELMEEIACACETLQRWQEQCEGAAPQDSCRPGEAPAFLRTEVFVRPLKQWEAADLRRLAQDADELAHAHERDRATALLQRWLKGLDIAMIATGAHDLEDEWPQLERDSPTLGRTAADAFEALGGACRRAGVIVPLGNPGGGIPAQAACAYEKGWVAASCSELAASLYQSAISSLVSGCTSFEPSFSSGDAGGS